MVAVADVLERIGVEDDEVCQFARLERADVGKAVEPGRIDGAMAQSLERRRAAADMAPQLPMLGNAWLLAVAADRDRHARRIEAVRLARLILVDELLRRRRYRAHASRQLVRRRVAGQ